MIVQVIGHLHHVRRFDDPLAAAGRNEEAEDRRVHTHQQGIGVVGGNTDEKGRDVVRQGLRIGTLDRSHQCGDRAVQRELDQHTGGGRYRTGHGIQKAARTPVQQRTQHDEQEVVGVQPGNRTDGRFGRELVEQPSGCQQHQQNRQQRAVFQPFAGAGAWLQRWQVEAWVDPAGVGVSRGVRAGGGGVGNDQ
ncbi:hypothetical protein D9M71_160450 [compost metagenome]